MIVPGWDTAQEFEDADAERSPFELALHWNVDLDRPEDFVGKAALLAERDNGSRFVMRGFEIDDECELEDGAELDALIDGREAQIGSLPSVSWSHDANRWIGLASIRTVARRRRARDTSTSRASSIRAGFATCRLSRSPVAARCQPRCNPCVAPGRRLVRAIRSDAVT